MSFNGAGFHDLSPQDSQNQGWEDDNFDWPVGTIVINNNKTERGARIGSLPDLGEYVIGYYSDDYIGPMPGSNTDDYRNKLLSPRPNSDRQTIIARYLFDKLGFVPETGSFFGVMRIRIPDVEKLNQNKDGLAKVIDGINDLEFIEQSVGSEFGHLSNEELLCYLSQKKIPISNKPVFMMHDYFRHVVGYSFMSGPVADFVVETAQQAIEQPTGEVQERAATIVDYLSDWLSYHPTPTAKDLVERAFTRARMRDGVLLMTDEEALEIAELHSASQQELIDRIVQTEADSLTAA